MSDQGRNIFVTGLSVIGLVAAIVGLLAAMIPCVGVYAGRMCTPAAITAGTALGLAIASKAKRSTAVIALIVAMCGMGLSSCQDWFFDDLDASDLDR